MFRSRSIFSRSRSGVGVKISDSVHPDSLLFSGNTFRSSEVLHMDGCGSGEVSVANLKVFPRVWACFFVELRFFFKTCGLLIFGLALIEICLFFGLVFCRFMFCGLLFFLILWHFCCFNLLLKSWWARFYKNLLILGLFFGFAFLLFI